MYTSEEIEQLSHSELVALLFAYSNYVMTQLEEEKQPSCIMEYYENDCNN